MVTMAAPTRTVGELLRDIEQRFIAAELYYGHGTDNAWDDAVAVVLFVLNLPMDSDKEVANRVLTAVEEINIETLIERRIKERIPVPYLTHQAWFAGLPFFVDQRVLIPRSPLAELIDSHFQPWIDADTVERIVDIGTGSACIAIACALAFPEAEIDAVDIDESALDVAKRNITQYQLTDRINIVHSDIFTALSDRCYDIIVSNPPYVDAEDMASLPAEYHHEPRHALASGADGLQHTRQILQHGARHLRDNGILVLEVGNSREALEQQFPRVPFVWLSFEQGGEGVFVLTKDELQQCEALL